MFGKIGFLRKALLPGLLLILTTGFIAGLHEAQLAHAAPPEFFQTTQLVTSGIDGPSGLGIAPDNRIFILERTGKILIYKNGNLLATPFTQLSAAATGDRGLTGIAFDPDFNLNHYVYIYYTGNDLINRLVRFDATTDVGQSMQVIYQTESPSFELHIGGTVAFGPDGLLYISIGDNGLSTNAQDLTNPHGKIIRINKDGSIPNDNPFVGQSGVREEIWAYGFRNPFRFQFDAVSGRLYAGDVGDASWEEVNLVEKGKNYGWPNCEGICNNPNFKDPIYTYPHNDQSSAVVGGPIYQGNMFPSSYLGKLFIGDYAQGFIKVLALNPDGTLNAVENFDLSAGSVVDMKQAPDGSIYYVTYIPGRLYRLTYSENSSIPVANATADVTGGNEPLTVNFSSNGSYDPDGDPLTYLWNFGDGTQSFSPNPTKVYTNKGTYTVELQVSDGVNSAISVPITIQVGIPPTINIASPTDGSTYRAGDTIFYTASAVDAAGFDLSDGDFTTEVLFHHATHIHPFLGPIVGKSGEFTIPASGEPDPNQWFEIIVKAKDSNGLTSTKSVNIYPQTVDISFKTTPANLTILLNGVSFSTPHTFTSVVGYEHIVSVDVVQQGYQFYNWSDNGKTQHIYKTPAVNSELIATFADQPSFEAWYFANTTLAGTPSSTQLDENLKFNWGFGSPNNLPVDSFSVRWKKKQFFSEGRYIFSTITDDGTRLFIDGNLAINKWQNQSPTRHNKIIYLSEGEHEIVMEYFEAAGEALAELEYVLALDQTPSAPTYSFAAKYWNFIDNPVIPTTPAEFSETLPLVWKNWQEGSPDTAIGSDHFVAQYTQNTTLIEGTYRFVVEADDGVRIKVDGNAILDKWIDQSPTKYTIDKFITTGDHTIVVEYYERGGGAIIEMSYQKISDTPPTNSFGLTAKYYDTVDFTGAPLTRIEPNINFNWGSGSPDPLIGADTFSARFSGKVTPKFTEAFTFYTVSDDGVRVFINGQKIIDKWIDQSPKEWASQPIQLIEGQPYDIVVDYYERAGGALIELLWSSASQTKQIIPQDRFTPDEVVVPLDGYSAKYWTFNGANPPVIPQSPPVLERIESSVYYNWKDGSPDPSLPADYFLAQWIRDQQLEAGNYEFKFTADDGARIYIDNQLVLDKWIDQSPTTYTFTQAIAAGTHAIKIEYYEKTGWAVAEFSYKLLP